MSQGTQCPFCKHRWPDSLQCDAFPEGIPDEILTGLADHTAPFPGDRGVQYEEGLRAEEDVVPGRGVFKA